MHSTRSRGIPCARDGRTGPSVRRIAGLLALAWLLPAPVARAEETILRFEWSTRTLAVRDGRAVQVDSSRVEATLCLGDTYFKLYDADGVWVYDFERRRVLRVNPGERTYADWSLYAFVAYNDLELARQSGRENPTRKAPAGVSIRELEARFGMPSAVRPHANEALVDSSTPAGARVLINGRLSLAAEPSDHALSPARAPMFERFLMHRGQLHPAARRAVLALGKVPRVLYWRFQDPGAETRVQLILRQVTSAPENSDPTVGCRRDDVGDPGFATLAQCLAASRSRCADTSGAGMAVPDSVAKLAESDLAAGRDRQARGDLGGSVGLTLTALGGDPCSVGAWVNLYRAYLGSAQPVLAWMCLDQARALTGTDTAPLADGTRFEQELVARHPEYFGQRAGGTTAPAK